MNIDLLFFESSFEKKEDYIKDQEVFQEYINTHSFEGNSNELLSVSYTHLTLPTKRIV